MDSQSDFLELVILGAIAAFLIYRLVSTLGQRSGFEQPRTPSPRSAAPDEPMPLDAQYTDFEEVPVEEASVPKEHKAAIDAIKAVDRDFLWSDFMEGATSAYEMVLEAFAKGDLATLKQLLAKDVYTDFAAAIKEREAKGHVLQTTLVRVGDITCENVSQQGALTSIRLRFATEQTHVVRDKKGAIVEGNPQLVEEIVDIWTFNRNLKSKNPNWTLVEVETEA